MSGYFKFCLLIELLIAQIKQMRPVLYMMISVRYYTDTVSTLRKC